MPDTERYITSSLPPLRLILSPCPGVGVDVRLPLHPALNGVLSAEAIFRGTSSVSFGVEARRFPSLRLTLAPCLSLSLRLPLAQLLSPNKFVHGGAEICLGPAPWALPASVDALRALVLPALEVQQRMGLLDVLLTKEERAALEEGRRRRALRKERERRAGEEVLRAWGQPPVENTIEARRKTRAREYAIRRGQRVPRELQKTGGWGGVLEDEVESRLYGKTGERERVDVDEYGNLLEEGAFKGSDTVVPKPAEGEKYSERVILTPEEIQMARDAGEKIPKWRLPETERGVWPKSLTPKWMRKGKTADGKGRPDVAAFVMPPFTRRRDCGRRDMW